MPTLFDPLSLSAISAIANDIRPEDRREVAAGMPGGAYDADAFAAGVMGLASDGFVAVMVEPGHEEPVAFVGVAQLGPGLITVAMAATPAWPRVALAVTDHIRLDLVPRMLEAGINRAEARSIDGHDQAHRWLRALGFVRECAMPDYGAGRETFHLFAWRRTDHPSGHVRL